MNNHFSEIFKIEDFKSKTISNKVLDFTVKNVKETLIKNNNEKYILNVDILSNQFLDHKSSKVKNIKNDYTVYLQYKINTKTPVFLDITIDVLFDKKACLSGLVISFDLMHDDIFDYIEDTFQFTVDDNFEHSEILCFEYFRDEQLLAS